MRSLVSGGQVDAIIARLAQGRIGLDPMNKPNKEGAAVVRIALAAL